jgi:transposase, IS5 family
MISSVRSRIEHAFGFIEESLGGSVVRSVGMIRAKFNITLTSLVYNICRLGQII